MPMFWSVLACSEEPQPASVVEGEPLDAVICPEFDRLVFHLEFDSYLSDISLKP